ncbi:MAG TPA: hypothetical protein VMW72_00195 [Sedimentisphaerales bacterium]|nr:hypothetical protein [Sedimentisphaerales bacterium]
MAKFDPKKVIEHLNKTWGVNRKCPMCESCEWYASDKVFELREYHSGTLVLGGGPIVPIVTVTCRNCGNTVLVNALVAGAIEAPKDEKEGTNG